MLQPLRFSGCGKDIIASFDYTTSQSLAESTANNYVLTTIQLSLYHIPSPTSTMLLQNIYSVFQCGHFSQFIYEQNYLPTALPPVAMKATVLLMWKQVPRH